MLRTVKYNPDHLGVLLRFANFCRVLIRQAKEDEEPQDVTTLYAQAEELSIGDFDKELELANHYLFTSQLEKALSSARASAFTCPRR